MSRKNILKFQQHKLTRRYKQLVEQAYNLKQTDHALSDDADFKAMKLLHKLNQIKFLSRDSSESAV